MADMPVLVEPVAVVPVVGVGGVVVPGDVVVDDVELDPGVALVRTNLVVVSGVVVVVPEVPVVASSARARQPVIVTLSVELALRVDVVVVCAANVAARATAIAAHAPVQNFWYIVPSLIMRSARGARMQSERHARLDICPYEICMATWEEPGWSGGHSSKVAAADVISRDAIGWQCVNVPGAGIRAQPIERAGSSVRRSGGYLCRRARTTHSVFCEGAIGPRALVAEDGTLDEQIKTDALPGTTLRPGEAIDSGLQRVADADAVTNWIA